MTTRTMGRVGVFATLLFMFTACEVVVDKPAPAPDTLPQQPGSLPQRPGSIHTRDNLSAEDMLDHWNGTQALQTVMNLPSTVIRSDLAEGERRLRALLRRAVPNSESTRAKFRNISSEDAEIVDYRNEIAYGQWKRGPAGMLNIEFDFSFAPDLSRETYAWVERAGKLWSWQLMDDFVARVARRGTRIFYDPYDGGPPIEKTLNEDAPVDDIRVIMLQRSGLDGGGANPQEFQATTDDYEPWLGAIVLGIEQSFHLSAHRAWANYTRMLAHEVGHILGYSGVSTDPSGAVPSFDRHIDRQNHTFEGPEAIKANGGTPVPFAWRDERGRPVQPFTPGATVDYGHPGVCSSVMAYCHVLPGGSSVYSPSELDFSILSDIGWERLDAVTASEPESMALELGAATAPGALAWSALSTIDGKGTSLRSTIDSAR